MAWDTGNAWRPDWHGRWRSHKPGQALVEQNVARPLLRVRNTGTTERLRLARVCRCLTPWPGWSNDGSERSSGSAAASRENVVDMVVNGVKFAQFSCRLNSEAPSFPRGGCMPFLSWAHIQGVGGHGRRARAGPALRLIGRRVRTSRCPLQAPPIEPPSGRRVWSSWRRCARRIPGAQR